MTDFNTQKLHDEVAKELFLDAVYRGGNPQESAVLSLINAEVFMIARASYLKSKDGLSQTTLVASASKSQQLMIKKGCNNCNGAGKVRLPHHNKNKAAPSCVVCNGAGFVMVQS